MDEDDATEQMPRDCRGDVLLCRCTGGIGDELELATAPFEKGILLSTTLVGIRGGMMRRWVRRWLARARWDELQVNVSKSLQFWKF